MVTVTTTNLTSSDASLSSPVDRSILLFSKFHEGIQIDKLGWNEVTPEIFASHISSHIGCIIGPHGKMLEICSGLGGNTIQFALNPNIESIVAIEIDTDRIKMAKENARIYSVDLNKIRFIHDDFLDMEKRSKEALSTIGDFDCVFVSPPWGGKGSHKISSAYPISSENSLLWNIIEKAGKFTSKILVCYLPPNIDPAEVDEIARFLGFKEELTVMEILTYQAIQAAVVTFFR
jgi:16S rRNA G966 N2-methylase RsmD